MKDRLDSMEIRDRLAQRELPVWRVPLARPVLRGLPVSREALEQPARRESQELPVQLGLPVPREPLVRPERRVSPESRGTSGLLVRMALPELRVQLARRERLAPQVRQA